MLYNFFDSLPLTLGPKIEPPKPVVSEWKATGSQPGVFVHRTSGLMKFTAPGFAHPTEAMCGMPAPAKNWPFPTRQVPVPPPSLPTDDDEDKPVETPPAKPLLNTPRIMRGKPPYPSWYMASGTSNPRLSDFTYARFWNGWEWSRAVLATDNEEIVNRKRRTRGAYGSNEQVSWLKDAPITNPVCAKQNASFNSED